MSFPSRRLTNANVLLVFLLAFLTGVFARSLWDFPQWLMWLLLLIALGMPALDFKSRRNWCLFFCFFGLALGIWRTESALVQIEKAPTGNFEGAVVIMAEPRFKEDYQTLTLQGSSSRFIAYVPVYPKYEYGDVLEISCKLERPENKYEKFNYVRFLAKDEIFRICKSPKISPKSDLVTELLSRGDMIKIGFFKGVYKVKHALEAKVAELFSQPEGAYLAGLLLGGDDRLPKDVAEDFRRTGTTHTVAVSGYNITILAQVLTFLAILAGFWRPQAFWVAIVGIVFFVLMIGSPASAVRAAVMGILILWAAKQGRLANSMRAIVLAAALMVWFSPFSLLYDVGFQLSFLAALGIVTIYAPLAEKFNVKTDFLELKSILLVTIAAQLGVLGILIYTFESFSPISLLANLLILPAIPYIMLSGFGVVLLGFVFVPVAKLLSLIVWTALHLEIKVIELLSEIPWASVEIKGLSWVWLVGYYVFLGLFIGYLKKENKIIEKDIISQ